MYKRQAALILVNRRAGFSVLTGFTPATPSNGAAVAGPAVTARAIELAGRPVAGETWTIALDGTNRSYTVVSGDTRSGLARKLADAVNAAAPAGFLAVADGTAVVIANTNGAVFTLGASVTAVPASETSLLRGAMTVQAATTTTRILAGTPVLGEIWAADLSVVTPGSTATAAHAVKLVDADGNATTPKTLQTLGAIAKDLAAAINADAQDAFTAFAFGDLVVVVERNGAAFSAAFKVLPAGALQAGAASAARVATLPAALVVGQTLSVTLVGNDLSTVISYTVAADGDSVESAASAAAHLAAAINASAPADYTATSDGATLVVVNRAGDRFTLADLLVIDTDETGLDGTASVSLLTLHGAPVVGATWAIRLDYDNTSRTVSHTVGIGETLSLIHI